MLFKSNATPSAGPLLAPPVRGPFADGRDMFLDPLAPDVSTEFRMPLFTYVWLIIFAQVECSIDCS